MKARWMRVLAGVVLALLVFLSACRKHADGVIGEELWICYVSTTVQAIGLIAGLEWLSSIGFMAMVALGFPGWFLDTIAEGTTVLSAAMHLASLAVGAIEARRVLLTRVSFWGAWALWVVMQPVTYFLTDPKLNVNVVFAPWPPMAPLFPNMTAYRIFNGFLAIVFLTGARFLVRVILEPRQNWRPDGVPR